jgi:hypothetical protein
VNLTIYKKMQGFADYHHYPKVRKAHPFGAEPWGMVYARFIPIPNV